MSCWRITPPCWLVISATVFAIASMTSSASAVSTLSEPACPIPCGPKSLSIRGVGISPRRVKRWHDRPRHTLQRSEARSRGSVASTVGRVQRFKDAIPELTEVNTGSNSHRPESVKKVENYPVKVEPVGEFELKGIRRLLAAYNVLAAVS